MPIIEEPGPGAWQAWELDHLTVGWIVWIAFFAVWEAYALTVHPGEELTAHLRPIFALHPLAYFLAVGVWLWLGIHFLAWRWEHRLLNFMVGG